MHRLLFILLLATSLALGPAAGLTIGCVCERVTVTDGAGAVACACCCAGEEGGGPVPGAACCCSAEPARGRPVAPDRAPAPGAGQIESWVAADLVGQPVVLPAADGRGAWGAAASAAVGWSARPGLSRLCVWRT